jgi:hypothetical protein
MSLVVVEIVKIIKIIIIKIVKIAGIWSCIDADIRILLLLLSCCMVVIVGCTGKGTGFFLTCCCSLQ